MTRPDYTEQARALVAGWKPMPVEVATHVGRLLAVGEVVER